MKQAICILAVTAALMSPASAQTFNQFLAFGDSTLDSGYFRYTPRGNAQEPRYAAARAAGGSITPSSGIMNTQFLASYFGLTANPVDAPGGGTNFAVSGARINAPNVGGGSSPSMTQQINTYLAGNGGTANPNALYVISAGGNDLTAAGGLRGAAFNAFIQPQIGAFVSAVAGLSSAGARYIVVPNSYAISFSGGLNGPNILSQGEWNGLAAAGVKFIPADVNAMRVAIVADPSRFGFTSVDPQTLGSINFPAACHPPTGANNASSGAFGLFCVPSTTPSAVTAYLNSPNSQQTSLFADDQHFSPAGQKIEADYIYSLLVAPSQISFLTESAIQFRRGVDLGIEEQIDITRRRQAPGFNVWFNGDLSSLKLSNSSPGFPSDPSTPLSGTLGASYAFTSNALIGGAVTLGSLDPSFSLGGGFNQKEVAATIFGAVQTGPLWADAIMSFGWLHYDVNRVVPIGISFDSNSASTHGQNFSFVALTGYDFHTGAVTHGPVIGVEIQSVGINSFTETGGFTALAFSNIGRTSTVSEVGYKAAIDYGMWRPFAQVTWNHEFDNTLNETITATLTTTTAPSYSLPIVQLGRDWASASLGTTVAFARGWTGLAAFTAQLGQTGTTFYGGRVGINYAFNDAPISRLITK
jgi:outer membrane lipase/esterase